MYKRAFIRDIAIQFRNIGIELIHYIWNYDFIKKYMQQSDIKIMKSYLHFIFDYITQTSLKFKTNQWNAF